MKIINGRRYDFQTTGVIKYDPHRPGLRRNNNWWCVVETDDDITHYYRWLLERRYHITTHPPSWGSHISIIRGERPPQNKQHLWKMYDGIKLDDIWYSGYIGGNGKFWWVRVYHPLFKQIRKQFNFPSNWGQHLTIARQHEKWPVRSDQFCN